MVESTQRAHERLALITGGPCVPGLDPSVATKIPPVVTLFSTDAIGTEQVKQQKLEYSWQPLSNSFGCVCYVSQVYLVNGA